MGCSESNEKRPPRSAAPPPNALAGIPGVSENYLVLSVLGRGAFGSVYRCQQRKPPGEVRAVKVLRAPTGRSQRAQTEAAVIRVQLVAEKHVRELDQHPNVLRCYECYEGRGATGASVAALVYECCEGGEVAYNLAQRQIAYRSNSVAIIMKGLLRALAHLHDACLVHMDIKPQNIVFAKRPDQNDVSVDNIRLIDFGSVTPFQRGTPSLTVAAGTPHFAAPEVLKFVCALSSRASAGATGGGVAGVPGLGAGVSAPVPQPFDERCDVYSATVVAFIILTGQHPFASERDPSRIQPAVFLARVMCGDLHLTPRFHSLKEEIQDFLRPGLHSDFRARPRTVQMLDLPWLAEAGRPPRDNWEAPRPRPDRRASERKKSSEPTALTSQMRPAPSAASIGDTPADRTVSQVTAVIGDNWDLR